MEKPQPTSGSAGPVFRVAVDAPAPDVYSYLAPPGLEVAVGQMVRVPLGGRQVLGYVLEPEPPGVGRSYRLKAIDEVVVAEPLFGPDMAGLVGFVSAYYHYPPGLCVKEILPGGLGPKLEARVALTAAGLARAGALTGGGGSDREGADGPSETASPAPPGPPALFSPPSSSSSPAAAAAADAAAEALARLLLEAHPEPVRRSDLQARKDPLARLVKDGLARIVWNLGSAGVGPANEWWLAPAVADGFKGRIGAKERALLQLVEGAPPTPLSHYRNILGDVSAQAKSLAKKGLILMEGRERFRDDPGRALDLCPRVVERLTDDQAAALAEVEAALAAGGPKGFLLFGVTGSGKTEIYLRAAAAALAAGRGVLWLAPEIALTMGLEGRLKSRFPDLRFSVLHSGLTPGQRHDHWLAIRRGVSRLALGARSAVFAPVPDLGLVVVDEEHDWAYKQDDGLRYNGRDLAAWRARQAGAVLLLGSATPSLESFHGTITGRLGLLRLAGRPGGAAMPEVVLVDRRGEGRGGREAIAREVRASLAETFERGEQALMFVNRRGAANLPMCLACGEVLKCPHCSLALTLHGGSDDPGRARARRPAPAQERGPSAAGDHGGGHRGAGDQAAGDHGPGDQAGGDEGPEARAAATPGEPPETHGPVTPGSVLICHGCGYRAVPPPLCPTCGSKLVRYLGVGTESLARMVERDFGRRGLRLDTDSARRKGGLKGILESFANRGADFLVGTQMAAKGHDFPHLTMVGVVEADLGLNVADFRAAERTFQLLSQVSGRAGRRERPGRVYIQTRNPGHYAMTSARDHDYEAFFQNEIAVRGELGYPPFARLALIRLSGPDGAAVRQAAERAAEAARRLIGDADPEDLALFGPAPAPVERLREKWRWQMMLRSKTVRERHRILAAWAPAVRRTLPRDIAMTVDVDPYNLL